jgi:hypothetical protein
MFRKKNIGENYTHKVYTMMVAMLCLTSRMGRLSVAGYHNERALESYSTSIITGIYNLCQLGSDGKGVLVRSYKEDFLSRYTHYAYGYLKSST